MKDPEKNPSERDPLLMDHEYDGIREYDNPMPRWWLYIFYACIGYSLLYWLNVPGIGIGKGRIANYEREMAASAALRAAAPTPSAVPDAAALMAVAHDPTRLALGKEKFQSTCSPCHAMDGGGGIGPNLTDAYWLHGARPLEVLKTVTEGVPDKGMLAWGPVLPPAELHAVVGYVLTLRGTKPKEAKEPQGINADSVAAAAATTGAAKEK